MSFPQQLLLGNQIKEDVMERACGTRGMKRNSSTAVQLLNKLKYICSFYHYVTAEYTAIERLSILL